MKTSREVPLAALGLWAQAACLLSVQPQGGPEVPSAALGLRAQLPVCLVTSPKEDQHLGTGMLELGFLCRVLLTEAVTDGIERRSPFSSDRRHPVSAAICFSNLFHVLFLPFNVFHELITSPARSASLLLPEELRAGNRVGGVWVMTCLENWNWHFLYSLPFFLWVTLLSFSLEALTREETG